MSGSGQHEDSNRSDCFPPVVNINRRDFLVGSASLVLMSTGVGASGCSKDAKDSKGSGRVVEVHDPQIVSDTGYNATRIKAMLHSGIIKLAQEEDIKKAWEILIPDFSPTMRIGLKANCLSSYLFKLHITEAFQAVIKGDTSDPPDTQPGRLLLSTDPVALDTHAVALMSSLRENLPPLPSSKLGWLERAAALNLGSQNIDLERITIA